MNLLQKIFNFFRKKPHKKLSMDTMIKVRELRKLTFIPNEIPDDAEIQFKDILLNDWDFDFNGREVECSGKMKFLAPFKLNDQAFVIEEKEDE